MHDTNNKYSKLKWKKIVKTEIYRICENELKNEIKKLEKLTEIKICDEQFQTKEYLKMMNIEDARTKFKLRTHMLDVKFNYKHMPKNEKSLWQCDSCMTNIDTQSHVLWCPAYSKLREGLSMDNDQDILKYYHEVMVIRDKLKLRK